MNKNVRENENNNNNNINTDVSNTYMLYFTFMYHFAYLKFQVSK